MLTIKNWCVDLKIFLGDILWSQPLILGKVSTLMQRITFCQIKKFHQISKVYNYGLSSFVDEQLCSLCYKLESVKLANCWPEWIIQ